MIHWEADEPIHFTCNNLHKRHRPLQSDDGFQEVWDSLPGDDVVRLERELEMNTHPQLLEKKPT